MHARRGLTLTDTAAAVTVFALASAVVMVGLGGKGAASGGATSARLHAALGQAQGVYIGDHDGAYAGVNTSGAPYQARGIDLDMGGIVEAADLLLGDTSSSTPTQVQDWMSPILGDTLPLSPNRAQRTADLLNRLGDPRAVRMNDLLFGNADDATDFEQVIVSSGFRQVSFLQPRSFQVYSSRSDSVPNAPTDLLGDVDSVLSRPLRTEHPLSSALVPVDFAPSIDHVGVSPSMKVMHADGTRYLAGAILDISIETSPQTNGNFIDTGPIYHASVAYGRANSSAPGNLELSFRGLDGSMLATMFDGSVRAFSRAEAWTNPIPWYPSGSLFTGSDATPESIEFAAKNLPDHPGGGGKLIP